MRGRAAAAVAGLQWLVCSAGVSCSLAWAWATACSADAPCDRRRRLRVLVTGFHDWHEISQNVWACKYNPTGRMLLGTEPELLGLPPQRVGAAAETDCGYNGPLVRYLKAAREDVDWRFTTLPVLWGISSVVDYAAYDVVVHMGLYAGCEPDEIVVEDGAYNARHPADCIGQTLPKTLERGCDGVETLRVARLTEHVQRHAGASLPHGFTIRALAARPSNHYICNETHWRALRAAEQGVLSGGYFVHVPFPAADDQDLEQLTAAVGSTIGRLVAEHQAPAAE
eukprot:TRINITY_DN8526_c0_g3_i1.p1 TRINITY_DN8526_c0_g3~~TRINITY_DN8526_c0_g3_i1.p1  ORF type:complete len:282 (+),score=55.09 TRINITY_DN8526_c0_g3_i1:135-980(+)